MRQVIIEAGVRLIEKRTLLFLFVTLLFSTHIAMATEWTLTVENGARRHTYPKLSTKSEFQIPKDDLMTDLFCSISDQEITETETVSSLVYKRNILCYDSKKEIAATSTTICSSLVGQLGVGTLKIMRKVGKNFPKDQELTISLTCILSQK